MTIEQADKVLRTYKFQETSLQDPRTHKRCISSVLRSIRTRNSGKLQIIPCRSSRTSPVLDIARRPRPPVTLIAPTLCPGVHAVSTTSAWIFVFFLSSPFPPGGLAFAPETEPPLDGPLEGIGWCAIFRGERFRCASAHVPPCLPSPWTRGPRHAAHHAKRRVVKFASVAPPSNGHTLPFSRD